MIQQAHHDRFAILGRHGGDTDVNALLSDLDREAAVLRQALFRDIEFRHQLEAQSEGRCDLDVGFGLQMQDAVDAKANLQAPFLRLDVNIGGPHLGRVVEHRLQQFDDRRFFQPWRDRECAEVDIAVAQVFLQFTREVGDFFGAAVDAVDRLQQLAFVDHG